MIERSKNFINEKYGNLNNFYEKYKYIILLFIKLIFNLFISNKKFKNKFYQHIFFGVSNNLLII